MHTMVRKDKPRVRVLLLDRLADVQSIHSRYCVEVGNHKSKAKQKIDEHILIYGSYVRAGSRDKYRI